MILYSILYIVMLGVSFGIRFMCANAQKKGNKFFENIFTMLLEFSVLPLLILPTIMIIEKIKLEYLIVIISSIMITPIISIIFRNNSKLNRVLGMSVFMNSNIIVNNGKMNYFKFYKKILLFSVLNYLGSLIFWFLWIDGESQKYSY